MPSKTPQIPPKYPQKWSKNGQNHRFWGFSWFLGVFNKTSIFSQTQPIFDDMSIYQILTKTIKNDQKMVKIMKIMKNHENHEKYPKNHQKSIK
jgi:hypothetical protein